MNFLRAGMQDGPGGVNIGLGVLSPDLPAHGRDGGRQKDRLTT